MVRLRTAAYRASAIGSVASGNLEGHFNLAYTRGGISREVGFTSGAVWAAASRLSLSAELLARRIQALTGIEEVVEPHPTLDGIDTIRLGGGAENATTRIGVVGVKWNATGSLLIAASLWLPLSDRGLKAGVAPMVSLDYAFAR